MQLAFCGNLKVARTFLVVAAFSGIVRIWSPIDRWFNLLGFSALRFADEPRDLTFFVLGILATSPGTPGNSSLPSAFPDQPPRLRRVLSAPGRRYLLRAVHWPHGYLPRDRRRPSQPGEGLEREPVLRYFWHPVFVILLQMAALRLPIGSGYKFLLVTVVAIPLAARRSPMVRKVLYGHRSWS